jgi:hypothetical protein
LPDPILRERKRKQIGKYDIDMERTEWGDYARTPTGGDTDAGEGPLLRIGSNHSKKYRLSARDEPIICKKLLFLHRYGIEQPARFQADIHFAV